MSDLFETETIIFWNKANVLICSHLQTTSFLYFTVPLELPGLADITNILWINFEKDAIIL